MILICLAFLIQPVYSSSERSQSISLDNLCNPLSIVNVCRGSPNFCNLSGYFSPLTRLPPIAGSQLLVRAIVSLYYLYNTTFLLDLNSIIYQSSPGFEPGAKSTMLPLCYTPLTGNLLFTFLCKVFCLVSKKKS